MSNLKNILSSFTTKDELNPKIWKKDKGETYSMRPNVRTHLLEIANDFIESLNVDIVVSDIIMTGSLANYNWSSYSDVDIHIIADFDQFPKNTRPLYEELFHLKKTIHSLKRKITIFGYDVEMYVEDESITKDVKSSGRFSLLMDEWVVSPPKESVKININGIKEKAKQWMKIIDGVEENIKDEDIETAKKLIKKYTDKVRKFRECGLEKGGEYSDENLVFKILRRNGYLDKLRSMKDKLIDKTLTLKEDEFKDPKLSDTEKSKNILPKIDEFYNILKGIDKNIYEQQYGSMTFQKEVEAIQIALDILGYPLPRFGVDGKFGPETAKAVNKFKTDNGISLDDIKKESIDIKSLIKQTLLNKKTLKESYDSPTESGDFVVSHPFDEVRGSKKHKGVDIVAPQGSDLKSIESGVVKVAEFGKGNCGGMIDICLTTGKLIRFCHANDIFVKPGQTVSKGEVVGLVGGSKSDPISKRGNSSGTHIHMSMFDSCSGGSHVDPSKFIGTGVSDATIKSSEYKGKSFISPEMVEEIIDRLMDIDLSSEELEKYTKTKLDFGDVVVNGNVDFSRGGFNRQQVSNINLIINELNERGITNPFTQVGILSVIAKESNFKSFKEFGYSSTSNSRIRSIFGNRANRYSDSELTKLKQNDENFFDAMYGMNSGMRLGNTMPGDGWKYVGRGLNGLTGRANYRKYGDLIGMDLESNPELLEQPEIAAKAAVAYFTKNKSANSLPNFNNKEDAINYFADLNAGRPSSFSRVAANKSSQSFDVVT